MEKLTYGNWKKDIEKLILKVENCTNLDEFEKLKDKYEDNFQVDLYKVVTVNETLYFDNPIRFILSDEYILVEVELNIKDVERIDYQPNSTKEVMIPIRNVICIENLYTFHERLTNAMDRKYKELVKEW